MKRFLFDKIDNSQLVIFRVFFGLLMVAECWGAIATGWVKETFVDPSITFTFMGMEWTQFLLGDTMYYLYAFMGFLGLLIMLGAFYRKATFLFFLLWGMTYLMQKSHYNNHYYLVWLISFFMFIVPAHRYFSVDSLLNPKIKRHVAPNWTRLLFMLQVAIVYIYAAVAKFYPGWVDNHFVPIILENSARWYESHEALAWFADFLRQPWLAYFLAYGGIIFDLLIVPLLLIKYTRKWVFIIAIFFHLFNSITLHIGIFPYFAMALCVFFFPTQQIQKLFFPKKGRYPLNEQADVPFARNAFTVVFMLYFLWQILLPLRHWAIPEDVLWTEEGHRLSWRMMLRTKSALATFEIKDPNTQVKKRIILSDYLTPRQIAVFQSKPDMIWQFAQYINRKHLQETGVDVEVYVKRSQVKINDGYYHSFINPEVDLAHTPWRYFGHQDWILPAPKDYYAPPEPKTSR